MTPVFKFSFVKDLTGDLFLKQVKTVELDCDR